MTWEPNRPAHVTQTQRLACFRRDLWQCQGCGWQSPRRDGRDLNADHVRNLASGGARSLTNLQTLYTPCHDAKTSAEALAGKRRAQRPRPIHPADVLGGYGMGAYTGGGNSTPSPSRW
jgi:5-methylcytosine-specific restriction endonuclease McrA